MGSFFNVTEPIAQCSAGSGAIAVNHSRAVVMKTSGFVAKVRRSWAWSRRNLSSGSPLCQRSSLWILLLLLLLLLVSLSLICLGENIGNYSGLHLRLKPYQSALCTPSTTAVYLIISVRLQLSMFFKVKTRYCPHQLYLWSSNAHIVLSIHHA